MKIIIRITLLLFSISLNAESTLIEGVVHDARTGEALPFVQIRVVGTSRGALSDADGRFEILAPEEGSVILRFDHVGYLSEQSAWEPASGEALVITLLEAPIDLEAIQVWGQAPTPLNASIHTNALSERSPRDVGGFFVGLPGASAVKKGGYAQDPNLRGMRGDQLNVQVDGGIHTWGGCPNRMDPPTSHVQADDLESIELVKGPYSVRWGPASGGIVNLVMKRPSYTRDTFRIQGRLHSAYDTNGDNFRNRVQIAGGNGHTDFYLGGGLKQFGDYQTGVDSIVMPADFKVADLSTKVGWNPGENARLQFSFRGSEVRDVDFPALPMDARLDRSSHLALDYSVRHLAPLLGRWSIKVYTSNVHHVMDNADRHNSVMVAAETVADARTWGGRTELETQPAGTLLLIMGVDYYHHAKDGTRERYIMTNPCNTALHPNATFVDPVWPAVYLDNLGAFVEAQERIFPRLLLVAGLRLDRMTAGIDAPPEQFLQRYGAVDHWQDTRLSWTGSARYRINAGQRILLALGQGARAADLTERFIYHLPVGRSPHEHFGNPDLRPEINTQADLTWEGEFKRVGISATVFASHLQDLVLAREDTTLNRLYLPCQAPAFTKVFENVASARRFGFEFEMNGRIGERFAWQGDIAHTLGENLTLDEPLAEMPPMEARLRLTYPADPRRFGVDLDLRWVADQGRISAVYGETATEGFSTVAIGGHYRMFDWLGIDVRVDNLLDVTYSEHLNRNFAGNTSYAGIPLYERGRNLTIQVKAGF